MRKLSSLVLLSAMLVMALPGCSIGGAKSTPTATTTIATTATTGGTATPAQTTGGVTPARARTPTRTTPRATPTRVATVATPLPSLATGQTYRDPQGRFSFTIPSNWVQTQAAGAEVAFQSPGAEGAVTGVVNIVLEKLPSSTITLDEYDQAGEQNLRQQFPDYTPISLDRVTVDGKQAYKRVYTATIASRLMQLQQIYLIDRDVAYIVTCGAPQDAFGTYTTIFDQISGTFKIGAP